jgi:NitT/TauT family transport system permease protein
VSAHVRLPSQTSLNEHEIDGAQEATAARAASRLRLLVAPVATGLAFLALWQAAAQSGMVNRLILPAPLDVADAFAFITWETGLVWHHAWVTVVEATLAFLLAASTAAALAISATLSPLFKRMIYPYMIAFQVTPRVAIAPAVIAALGFGMEPKIVIGAGIAFFPIFLNVLTGLSTVDPDTREMFRSLGASRRKIFTNLMLPSAAPISFAGLQAGISFALIGAVVGEFFSSSAGLGFLLTQFSFELNMPAAFAVFIWLTLLGLTLFGVTQVISRLVVFWIRDEDLVARSERRARRAAKAGIV